MRLKGGPSARLVIEDTPFFLPAILALGAAVVLVLTVASLGETPVIWRKVIGGGLGAAICAAGACLVFKRSRFVFDFPAKTLTWTRRGIFKRTGGTLGLECVKSVVMQSIRGSESTPVYRVALITTDGELPVTDSYGNNSDRCQEVATVLRSALGGMDGDLIEDSARELAAAGRVIDATRLLREHKRLSLTDARSRIEGFRTAGDA